MQMVGNRIPINQQTLVGGFQAADGSRWGRPVAAVADPMSPADAAALRARATNSRRSLEGRLKSEEGRLSALEKEFNGGEPERHVIATGRIENG